MNAATLDPAPLARLDDEVVTGLRDALTRAGFDDAFIGRVEEIAPGQLDQIRLPAVHWWLRRQAEPAATLARLFAYSEPVSSSELAEALPEALWGALRATGLLDPSGDRIASRARIMPFEGIWIASDEMDAAGDPVMGPGATTAKLARSMSVAEGESVLDVGCGAGSLALVAAARGAGEVVGLDLMERAVTWSQFNARLNGLEATFMAGDLTAPIRGRRFDRVVSQPPYVIQPPSSEATTYLHGGRRGDELALRLLSEIPEVLAPGGRALVFFDAPLLPGSPIEARLREALGEAPLQLLAVVSPGHSAEMQAIAYSAIRHPALDRGYRDAVDAACGHLAEQGIEANAQVLLAARRPLEGEGPLTVVLEADTHAKWDAETIDRLQEGAALATLSDGRLLERRLGLSQRAWLVQEQALGGRRRHKMRVRFEEKRAPDLELSDAAAVLVQAAMSASTVRDLVSRYAKAARAKPAEVRSLVLAFVRQALVSGLMIAH